MEKTIKVFIQGETDWLIFDYNQSLIDGLICNNLDRDFTSGTLGQLLDGDPITPLTQGQRERIGGILAKYVANLNSYQMARQADNPALFITTFRSSKPKKKGYLTRVAGIRSSDPSDPDSSLETNEKVYFAFLGILGVNPVYSQDRYDRDSTFHELNSRAQIVARHSL